MLFDFVVVGFWWLAGFVLGFCNLPVDAFVGFGAIVSIGGGLGVLFGFGFRVWVRCGFGCVGVVDWFVFTLITASGMVFVVVLVGLIAGGFGVLA